MTKIIVDGQEIDVPGEYTLLQACEAGGAEIPRFCYHERLSIAGNCRMCLIEVKGAPKPVASCAQQVKDQPPSKDGSPPTFITNSPLVQKARHGVMEFLLINHPLDCPICDQGGECDLQDQSLAYGRGGTRFEENKRAVEDKFMGPLVKTSMNRCIQCTRCVRFATEVAGVPELGATGRGEDMEITTYLEGALSSELSANVVDLCPVGALTSKPYAFNARPWELTKTETVDVMDALGSAIRLDARNQEVMRCLPRTNEGVNEEWISDKTRHAVDGLRRQRLDRPYVREGGKLKPATWGEALRRSAAALQKSPAKIGAVVGDLACAESIKALRDLLTGLSVTNLDCRQDGAKIGSGPRQSYLFNSTIAGIDQADVILLVGANPRWEAPVLNARLRKAWLRGARIGLIGEARDLTYRYEHLGEGPKALSGSGPFYDALKGASKPMVIVGAGALAREDGPQVLHAAAALAKSGEGWNGFNVLHSAASRVAALDLGFLPGEGGMAAAEMIEAARFGRLETLFLLGADEIDLPPAGASTVIYLGSHGDKGASRADIILPAAAYSEKSATWVNTEGRVQFGRRAVFPKGEAKEDWAIIRALSGELGRPLPYDDLDALRAKMITDHPSFGHVDYAPGAIDAVDLSTIGAAGPVSSDPFVSTIQDFYFTNPIARASQTMAECSKMYWASRAAPASVAAE
jgi:NADH-quinone oxidoreductase subunit G